MSQAGEWFRGIGIQAMNCLGWCAASQSKIESGTEGVYIDPCPDPAVTDILFWRGIACFQDYCILRSCLVFPSGSTEVDEMELIIHTDDQIVRADITMDQTLFMDFCQ